MLAALYTMERLSILQILHDNIDGVADYVQQYQWTLWEMIAVPCVHTVIVLSVLAAIFYGYRVIKSIYSLLFQVYRYKPDLPYLQGRARSKLGRVTKRGDRKDEMPPGVPNGWYYIMPSCELEKEEVKHVNMLGLDLAVFRDDKGIAHVLDAFCPHLGANMAVGGKVKGSCLECPFHAWQFDGHDGKCTNIPGAKKIPSIAKTKSWPALERNLVIMLWFDAEDRDPQWVPREFEEIHQKGWVLHAIGEHIMHAHISEIPENGADIAHFEPVHAKSALFGSDLETLSKSNFSVADHSWKDPNWYADENDWFIARGTLEHDIKLFNTSIPLTCASTTFEQMGPGMVYLVPDSPMLGGKVVLLMFVIPMETFKQKVIHLAFGRPSLLGKLQAILGFKIEGTMVERDAVIWNNKVYRPKGVMAATRADELIVKFRRWFAQFYSENSHDRSIQKTDLTW